MTPPKPKKPLHQPSYESMVSWGCLCGARWYNDQLRGKRDDELVIEREVAFTNHVRDMEKAGYG